MDKELNKNLPLNLKDLKLFTENDIEVFSQYGILTFEQLLGATKGLTNMQLFDAIEDRVYIINKLKYLISDDELKMFREFDTNFPTGLIIDDYE